MATISVVIIAKNEEQNIRPCIESALWADEIVVVDDKSTDNTVVIAKELGAVIYEREMDYEGRHRNYAYSLAKSEWVLSLDADERVTEELAKEIRSTIDSNPENNVFCIPIKAYIGKHWIKYAGYYPAHKDRLFRKGKFRYDEEAGVHPRVFYEGKSGTLHGDIIHYSYDSFFEVINKLNRETTLEAQKWVNDGRKVSMLRVLRKCTSRFLKFYWQKGGYKGGFLGFMFSLFHVLYQLFSYAHYWDLQQTVSNKKVS